MTTAVVIGDSYCTQPSPFWATMAARLGWTVTANAYGGTGYATDSTPYYRYGDASRVLSVVAAAPDVVLITGGINDAATGAQAGVQAGCTSLIASLQSGLPLALIIVVAPFAPIANGWYALEVTREAVVTAAMTAGVELIDPMGTGWPSAKSWITGTGNVGTPLGDGNADVYTLSDNAHPTLAGRAYIGTRLAFAIKPPATGLDY